MIGGDQFETRGMEDMHFIPYREGDPFKLEALFLRSLICLLV